MLPLYLLAAHLVGDFVLQTRWQAAGKLGGELVTGDGQRLIVAPPKPARDPDRIHVKRTFQ